MIENVLAPVSADIDPALVEAEYDVVLVAAVQLPLAVVAAELDVLTVNVPGVVVVLVILKLLGGPGRALVTVIELLLNTGVEPLLFVAVTLQDIAFPTSATTVE